MRKLRARAPPLTQTLEPEFRRRVLRTLFPQGEREREIPLPDAEQLTWDSSLDVTEDEVIHHAKRIGNRKAPGPDGIPGKIAKLAYNILSKHMAEIFTECLRIGYFPEVWKEATLILLTKEGKPKDSPSAYRPICLLGEAGKLFERVIANRLVVHLNQTEEKALSPEQFGFRQGRSTIDAVDRMRTIVEDLNGRRGSRVGYIVRRSQRLQLIPMRGNRKGVER